MSILGALERRMAMGPTDDSWYYPGGSLYGGTSGAKTKSGAPVTEDNAMRLSVFWACVKILSEDVASLPLHLYRKLPGGGKERATDHPLYSLLHDQPNPEMTSMSFSECGQAHRLTWGNSYCEIERGRGKVGRSQVVALWPITPNRVTVKRDDNKQIVYKVTLAGGSSPITLPKRQILHVPGLGFNGVIGYSPVAFAREAIGLGLALEEYSELYFGQGTHPGVVVSHPGKLSQQGHDNLQSSLMDAHSGLGKSHRLMLLEEAMKIEKLGIDNKDSQFIESKKYSNIDIGTRIMRVPPYMYGEMEKSAWANVEQQALDYVVKTLRPWLVRYEQALNSALLSEDERGTYFFEHLVDGMLRGDIKSRYEAYAVGRNNGWLNADEIREFENMNPMESGQGKIYLIPLNMIPATQAGKEPDVPAPTPAQNNRAAYRFRIDNAFRGVIADAAGRVVRKEAQRVRWIMEKPEERGGFDEFYREFPGYVRMQMIPAFSCFSEAIIGMETVINGRNYDDSGPKITRFVSDYAAHFAADYIESSRAILLDAVKSGEWAERSAQDIAEEQAKSFGDATIECLKSFQ